MSMELVIEFHNQIITGKLQLAEDQQFGLDYWIACESINPRPFTSEYYDIKGEAISENVYSKYITPLLVEINYEVRKNKGYPDGEHEVLTCMSKLIGVTDLWSLIEYYMDKEANAAEYKYSFKCPPWHHLVSDIQSVRIGVNVPTFVTIEPERSKWANKRTYTNRLFRLSMIGKGAKISLSMDDLRRNLGKANKPKLEAWRKVLSGARVAINNDGLQLDLKSFSSAEDFIEFQHIFTKVFMK